MNTILKLLTSVGGVISSFFTWKNSAVSQRRETEQDIEKKEAEKSSLKAEIKHAVYNEDDDKLNEIVSRIMMLFFIAFAFLKTTEAVCSYKELRILAVFS